MYQGILRKIHKHQKNSCLKKWRNIQAEKNQALEHFEEAAWIIKIIQSSLRKLILPDDDITTGIKDITL
jgi:hypothetical protein